MGTRQDEPLGYPNKALDLWAKRARLWATGGVPKDLIQLDASSPAKTPRDVYLYVISGYKLRNPAAAGALLERI